MNFGEFFKQKRLGLKLTLRKFCEMNEYDPGNISKLERGILPPPHSDEKLEDYAEALKIKKNSDDYVEFLDLASAANRTFNVQNIKDEAVLSKLPMLFRTLDNKHLTSEKLERIIELVKSERKA